MPARSGRRLVHSWEALRRLALEPVGLGFTLQSITFKKEGA